MKILFRIYRVLISPFIMTGFGIQCRYEESCSLYAERAIREKGLFLGIGLGLLRILKCNPFFEFLK